MSRSVWDTQSDHADNASTAAAEVFYRPLADKN